MLPRDCKVDTAGLKGLVKRGEALENLMKVQGLAKARQDEMHHLQAEIAQLRGQLVYDEAQNTDLKSQLQNLLQEVQSRESNFSKKVKNHCVIIDKRREKQMELDQVIVEKDSQRDMLQSQVNQTTGILGDWLTRLSSMKMPVGVVESLESEIKHEELRRNEQESYLREAEVQKYHLNKQRTQMIAELAEIGQLSQEVTREILDQEDHISSLRSAISSKKGQSTSVAASNSSLQQEIDRETDALNAATHKRDIWSRDLATVSGTVADLKCQTDSYSKNIKLKRQEVESGQTKSNMDKREVERVKLEAQRLVATISDVSVR